MWDKKVDDSITLVLTYHSTLNQLDEMLRRAHEHVLKPPRLHSALPSPPRVAFQNPKTIREKLVHFRLKEFIYKDAGNSISVVILSVIKVKHSKVEISLKVTELVFHLIVTNVALSIYWHAKYALSSM